MNQLQAFVARLFRLEKPLEKRWLWLAIAAVAACAFAIYASLHDGSTNASIATSSSRNASKSMAATRAGQDAASNGSPSTTFEAPKLYVHVVGEVVHPGLYILQSGARLADAILAADGFSRLADQASVNLARLISDGEQVVVARIGAATSSTTGRASGAKLSQLVNLNRASEPEIEGLPGVGPTLAGRIIDWRLANGGFRSKADLQKVAGIGDKLFAQLKGLVTF